MPFVGGLTVFVCATCNVDGFLREVTPLVVVLPLFRGACLLVLSVLAPVWMGDCGTLGVCSVVYKLLPTLIDGIRLLLALIGAAAIISSCFLPGGSRFGEGFLVVFSMILSLVIDCVDFCFNDPLVLFLDS